jgi:hypothetical protein
LDKGRKTRQRREVNKRTNKGKGKHGRRREDAEQDEEGRREPTTDKDK